MQCQKKFIVDGVLQNLRCDGREVFMSRKLIPQVGTEMFAAGSSQLAIELNSPHLISGCKAEIASSPEISLHIEILGKSSVQSRENLTHLSETIQSLMLQYFDTSQLVILDGKKGWKLYVDVLILDGQASNLIDHISLSIILALRDTKIPHVKAFYNPNSQEVNLQVTGEYFALQTDSLPVIVTVSILGGQPVLDLSPEEEACADGSVHISINNQAQLSGAVTGSAGNFPIDHLWSYVYIAKAAASQLFQGQFNYSVVF